MTTVVAAEAIKLKVPKPTLTEVFTRAFTFVGSPKSTPDAIAYDKRARHPTGRNYQVVLATQVQDLVNPVCYRY